MGILCRFFKTHIKTHGAADTAFGFEFHAFGFGEPFFAVVFVVVVFVDEGNAEFIRKAHVFFFAQHIFFVRMDIGVVKINGVVDATGKQGFHYFSAARGAAGMQQDFFMAAGRNEDGAVDIGNDRRGFFGHGCILFLIFCFRRPLSLRPSEGVEIYLSILTEQYFMEQIVSVFLFRLTV